MMLLYSMCTVFYGIKYIKVNAGTFPDELCYQAQRAAPKMQLQLEEWRTAADAIVFQDEKGVRIFGVTILLFDYSW